MAELLATRASRGHRTLCLPFAEESYFRVIDDPIEFRRAIDERFQSMPELFPAGFAEGYRLKDDRVSVKRKVPIRRLILKDGTAYGVRPSFLMPYMTARTDDVQGPLFLRKFAVPFWALARVFGRDPMYWYRIECGLGRFSIIGTTVRRADLPEHLLADEHHQTLDGQKVYIATTIGSGCILGAEPATTAGTDDLKAAYSVFKQEAEDVTPKYVPKTVNTDGWKGTKAAWKILFKSVVILQCFLHAWLKIRERGKHAARLGDEAHGRGRPGEGPRPVPEARPLVDRVPPPRRAPHEQHARQVDARDESLLRPWSAPAWLAGSFSAALPGLGVAVELRPLAPGDDARE
jgi:hypothetical protein